MSAPHCEGVQTKRLRRLQRNRCYLCGEHFLTPFPKGLPDRRRLNREGHPTLDHVRPRSRGHGLWRNKLLAHAACNTRKGDREPRPCELLYLDAILVRAAALRPSDVRTPQLGHFWGFEEAQAA